MIEKETGFKIKALRSDNGTEYINSRFEQYFKKHGIKHQRSTVNAPEQNGFAERANRKLVENAKCMLFDANLDISYWAEAVNTAAYILNRSSNHTPEELWSGKKANVSHLQIFGKAVMVDIPKQNAANGTKTPGKLFLLDLQKV